jgi:hypothetical protein
MELSKAVDAIRFDPDYFPRYLELLRTISIQVNAILAIDNYQKFRAADRDVRLIIQKAMGKTTGKCVMKYEPD